jgi:hypothetical protein
MGTAAFLGRAMTTTVRAFSVALAGVALLLVPLGAQEERDLDVLLDRLAIYLEQYEGQLSSLLADEHYVQEEQVGRWLSRRTTEAEVLFLRLPGEAEWFGVRDVKTVDGKPVTGAGTSLSDLLKKPSDDLLAKAAAIVEASSRHNLGSRRTINMPTVPLEALSARNQARYIFKVGGAARVGRQRTRRLEFQEFDEPTLVHSVDGGSLWTRGTAWIDAANGAVWRAELIVGPDRPGTSRRIGLESRVRVEFQRDAALDLLVPKELVETFWIRRGVGSGRGRYSNFRKFATSARIIPGAGILEPGAWSLEPEPWGLEPGTWDLVPEP